MSQNPWLPPALIEVFKLALLAGLAGALAAPRVNNPVVLPMIKERPRNDLTGGQEKATIASSGTGRLPARLRRQRDRYIRRWTEAVFEPGE